MLLHGPTSTRCSTICHTGGHTRIVPKKRPRISPPTTGGTVLQQLATAAVATTAAVLVLSISAVEVAGPQQSDETLSNIPQTLSSVCTPEKQDCKKRYIIQRPKSKKAETCTSKCAGTCLLGGFGSPGEGPFNNMRPQIVFKEGFHSRKYCLAECSDICNLIGDGDKDGP